MKDGLTQHQPFLWIYAFIGIADLFVLTAWPEWRFITKPLIMISLMVHFLRASRQIKSRKAVYIFGLALVFAWLGDVFLLAEDRFIFGLGSFLIMQLLYVICFLIGHNFHGKREWFYAALLLATTAAVNFMLWPHVGDLRIPVIVYTLAIGLMSYVAYSRDLLSKGYMSIWIGTVFFLVSDSLLAINLFNGPIAMGGILVMSTYIIAQFMITVGYIDFLTAGD